METLGKEQLKEFLKSQDIEDTIEILKEFIIADLEKYKREENPHDGVVACLEGTIEHLGHASLAYYASFK
jgi:hypothetical protein